MARKVYPRTVVEGAPSHDGKPCYAAWQLTETRPDTETPPDASSRPKWSIQFYDTTPLAGDPEHVRAMAQKLEESTRRDRDGSGSGAPSRVELHGFPLPADAPESERVKWCMAHHRAEVAARNSTGATDFFIPPTFDDTWEHQILIIDETEASWDGTGEKAGGFLAVFFSLQSQARAKDPHGADFHVVRFPGTELGRKLPSFTESIGWFYESYVEDGTIYKDLEKWQKQD